MFSNSKIFLGSPDKDIYFSELKCKLVVSVDFLKSNLLISSICDSSSILQTVKSNIRTLFNLSIPVILEQ